MENRIMNQNILRIKECDELLYVEMSKYDLTKYEIENTELETALDGNKIVKVRKDGYEWYLNSKYEPSVVAEQWVRNLGKVEDIATIVIYGLGDGLILKNLVETTGENVVVIVYEPSLDVFLRVLYEIDLSFLDKRVFILVDGLNESYFERIFEAFVTYENLSVCKFVGHPNYWSCYQNSAMEYLKRLEVILNYLDLIFYTKLMLCDGYYKNTLYNLKYLYKASVLDQVVNRVGNDIPRDLPAILVSAGPSLSKNIKQLKKAKGKSFIIATDSALRGLLKEGIIPDAFATIDPQKPLNRFEELDIENIPLICTESARFEIVERSKDKLIFANTSFGFGNVFFRLRDKAYGIGEYGHSVATFAYSVAVEMGLSTIIMVGQDLAFTNETRYYDGVKEWSNDNNIPEHLYLDVEDIHGNMVRTSKDLAVYIDWFEKQIEKYPHIDVIDATEGGAKIHGSKIMNLSESIERHCQNTFDMTAYLRAIPEYTDENDKSELVEFKKQISKDYNKLYQDSKIGIEYYEELINMINSNEAGSGKMMALTQKINRVMKGIEDNMVYSHVQHKLEKASYTILNNFGVSKENKIEDALQVASRGKQMLETLRLILEEEVLLEVEQVIMQ